MADAESLAAVYISPERWKQRNVRTKAIQIALYFQTHEICGNVVIQELNPLQHYTKILSYKKTFPSFVDAELFRRA